MAVKIPNLKNFDISFFKNSSQASGAEDKVSKLEQEIEILKLQIDVLFMIIERYRAMIEETEAKSVAELSTLVKPTDGTITELKVYIEDHFHPYIYSENFILATQKALDIVFSWKKIKLPISFWMSFDQMLKLKAADDIDLAVLICSLFRALGSDSAKVVIGKDKSAWVFFTFNNKDYIVDIAKKSMSAYPHDSSEIKEFFYLAAYAFNDLEHADFTD